MVKRTGQWMQVLKWRYSVFGPIPVNEGTHPFYLYSSVSLSISTSEHHFFDLDIPSITSINYRHNTAARTPNITDRRHELRRVPYREERPPLFQDTTCQFGAGASKDGLRLCLRQRA